MRLFQSHSIESASVIPIAQRLPGAHCYTSIMDRMKARAETAISSGKEFQQLLGEIESMDTGQRELLLQVVKTIEEQLVANSQRPAERARRWTWRQVLGVLTMGFDLSLQSLINKSVGPDAKLEVVIARIEKIKSACARGSSET